MDLDRFDALTRSLASRRATVAALLAAFLPAGGGAEPRGKPAAGGSVEGCVPNGQRCGKGSGKPGQPGAPCKRCCSRYTSPTPAGPRRCSCRPTGETCGNACAARQVCDGGARVACDVCPSGCAFGSVQAAVDAAAAGATVRVCAGLYAVDGGNPSVATIAKNLTVVGAGPGDDPATNTVLDGQRFRAVLTIKTGATVAVRGVRFTGGAGGGGDVGGVRTTGALTLTDRAVIGNTARLGGGLHVARGTATLTDRVVSDNVATNAGGGGGIDVDQTATLNLIRTRVNRNAARGGAGISTEGVVNLSASRISGNNFGNCLRFASGRFNDPGDGREGL